MNREERLRQIQDIYRNWSNEAEFIDETTATPKDEDKFYESLMSKKLIPVEETKQQLLIYPLLFLHG